MKLGRIVAIMLLIAWVALFAVLISRGNKMVNGLNVLPTDGVHRDGGRGGHEHDGDQRDRHERDRRENVRRHRRHVMRITRDLIGCQVFIGDTYAGEVWATIYGVNDMWYWAALDGLDHGEIFDAQLDIDIRDGY